jgi:hypothetical protein
MLGAAPAAFRPRMCITTICPPFYAVNVQAAYDATAVGAPVRYLYDGQVINLKIPTASYFLPRPKVAHRNDGFLLQSQCQNWRLSVLADASRQ